jgi:hypothetical protein
MGKLTKEIQQFSMGFHPKVAVHPLGSSSCYLACTYVNTLFDDCIENHACSLALLLIYIDFDSKLLKGLNQTAY